MRNIALYSVTLPKLNSLDIFVFQYQNDGLIFYFELAIISLDEIDDF